MPAPILTVGHGLLDAGDLGRLLTDAEVALLVDVRSQPWSRRNLDARKDALERWVPAAGIAYRWERDLGGRRGEAPPDRDPAIAHPSLRAYAAHMRSSGSAAALQRVLDDSERGRCAVMCAEGDWRRCHRRFIADTLMLVHGRQVAHLGHDGVVADHVPHVAARVTADGLVYDLGTDRPLPGTS